MDLHDKHGVLIKAGDTLRLPEEFGETLAEVSVYANGELGLKGQDIYIRELVDDKEVVASNP